MENHSGQQLQWGLTPEKQLLVTPGEVKAGRAGQGDGLAGGWCLISNNNGMSSVLL